MVKDGTMNLVIGIWEKIKTNITGENNMPMVNGKNTLTLKKVRKLLRKLRRKKIKNNKLLYGVVACQLG